MREYRMPSTSISASIADLLEHCEETHLEIPECVDVLRETEIRDFNNQRIPTRKKQVLGFQVAVNDPARMHVLKMCEYLITEYRDYYGTYRESVAHLTCDSLSLMFDCTNQASALQG